MPRAFFLHVPIDVLTRQQSIDVVVDAIEKRRRLQHCVVNVAKIVNMRRSEDLKYDVESSDLINVDGMGVVWGARILGIDVPERVAGIDLFEDLLGVCAERGFRPFFFGAQEHVVERAAEMAIGRFPGLELAGYRNGYFSTADEAQIVEQIRSSQADCLFVAISTPMKERFIAKYRDELGVPLLMGVGGSFDVLAGVVDRAPKWMQAFGLEWFYRLLREPRRMWRRYLVTNSVFAILILRELFRRMV